MHYQEQHERLDPIAETRSLLAGYVRQVGLGWPEPDDAICERVLGAAAGDVPSLWATLRWLLLDRRLAPRESYAWFEAVVRGSLRRRA